jgi:hypothetical protein
MYYQFDATCSKYGEILLGGPVVLVIPTYDNSTFLLSNVITVFPVNPVVCFAWHACERTNQPTKRSNCALRLN